MLQITLASSNCSLPLKCLFTKPLFIKQLSFRKNMYPKSNHRHIFICFLAHLAFRPCELLSSLFVRRPSVNISHFNLLLRNHQANCNQTLVEWSLASSNSSLPLKCLFTKPLFIKQLSFRKNIYLKSNHRHIFICFLAHLAFRPCELLPSLFVRRPSVNISHFNLLLRNHQANCNQTLVEWSLGCILPKLCPVIPASNQDGRQVKNRKKGDEI